MEKMELNGGVLEFKRQPGRRGGCGCCGFWFAGLFMLPVAAMVALVMVI